jgi:hypothetical protein
VLVSVVFGAAWALVTGQGPAWVRDSRERVRAQSEQARAQAALADEERRQIELDRRRVLNGWSPGGIEVYGVALVTDPAEMDTAREQLAREHPAGQYVILRIAESDNVTGDAMRAHTLRQLIERTGCLARAPEAGEYEALLAGIQALAREQHREPAHEVGA